MTKERLGKTWCLKNRYLVMKEKAEVLNDYFTSVFTREDFSHTYQASKGKGRNWEKEDLPTASEDQVLDLLKNLKVDNYIRPDENHPWVLREQEDEVVKLLSVRFDRS